MKIVLTCGTFDLFHFGHLRLLQRAKSLGDKLIVGVSSDSLNVAKKQRKPIYSEKHRMAILSSLKCVDEVFVEESLEDKLKYLQSYNADIFVIGDDWEGKFDWIQEHDIQVKYLNRTPSISTTELIEMIKQ